MSNELTIAGKTYDVASYMERIAGASEELRELEAECNPFEVMVRLKLSKESKEIVAIQNDEIIARFGSSKPLYFVCLLISEKRTLWNPSGSEDKSAACRTNFMKIGTFRRSNDTGVGIMSDGNSRKCATCPYNQFDSIASWDPSKGASRGKACQEQRLLVGVRAVEVGKHGNIPLYEIVRNEPLSYMYVPGTSIGAVRAIGNACVSRNVAPRYTVFKLTNDLKAEGSMTWGVLSSSLVGFIAPQSVDFADREAETLRRTILEVPVRDEDLDDNDAESPKRKADLGRENFRDEMEDEIPF